MREFLSQEDSRRRFLRFLAGSPLLAIGGFSFFSIDKLLAAASGQYQYQHRDAGIGFVDLKKGLGPRITSPDQAASVFDFVPVAQENVPPAHFGWLVGAAGDDSTLRADEGDFKRFQILPRRLVDVQNIDMSVRLFGTTWSSPIALDPVWGLAMFHPNADILVAKGARTQKHLMMMSTGATASVEDITAARGAPIWYQLYPTNVWEITRGLVKRAEAAGCPAIVLTVDFDGGSDFETAKRFMRVDPRNCSTCHVQGNPILSKVPFGVVARGYPMFAGLDVSKMTFTSPPSLNWDFVKRLRDATTKKLLIKGILRRDDAERAVEHGVDGIIVSNHGGRVISSGRSTIMSLPDVVKGVKGRVPVLVDSGFRRGTDVFKALALGATAVCVGRPYVYGVAAFGQPGVEAVLQILRHELRVAMGQAGTTSVDKITPDYLVERACPDFS